MALSQNTPLVKEVGDVNEIPVAATTRIYEGGAVGDNGSGYARALNAGDPFLGFAESEANNSAGAAGDIRVRVWQKGQIRVTITGVAITDRGKPVYMSDDGTFTLTATSNSHVGRVIRYVTTNAAVIAFDATRDGRGALTALTDNSGGTASDTLASISDTATKNAVASLAAKVNALLAQMK